MVAGGIVGAIVGIGVLWDWPLDPISAGAGYAGAFVGLLSPSVTESFWLVIAAAVVCGVLWPLAGPSVWDGIGGRMGLVAFLASCLVYVVADLFGAQQDYSLVPLNMGPVAHWMIVPAGAIGALLTEVVMDRLHAPLVLTSAGLPVVVCRVPSLTTPVPQATLDVAQSLGQPVSGGWRAARFLMGARSVWHPSAWSRHGGSVANVFCARPLWGTGLPQVCDGSRCRAPKPLRGG